MSPATSVRALYIVILEDLAEPGPIRIRVERHYFPTIGQKCLDHPGADESARPGHQHGIPIAHAAMLSGPGSRSDRLTRMAVTLSPKGTRGTEIPGFAKALMKAGSGLGNLIFNTMGDRMKMQGQPLVLLTTIGAKSGKQRKALLGRFDDTEHPGAWLVVGSYGGAARHPGWCHNLAANPDKAWATVDKQKTAVRADSVEGDDYRVAWDRIVSLAPGYGSYLQKTDRRIPIIRLTPVEG